MATLRLEPQTFRIPIPYPLGHRLPPPLHRLVGQNGAGRKTYQQDVLHSDDAAVQDGGPDGWDFDCVAMPGLPGARCHHVATQLCHHGALLLGGAACHESLDLRDAGPGHHAAGGRVLKLRKNGDHLSYRKRGEGDYVWNYIIMDSKIGSGP